jgi:hypothetical protein
MSPLSRNVSERTLRERGDDGRVGGFAGVSRQFFSGSLAGGGGRGAGPGARPLNGIAPETKADTAAIDERAAIVFTGTRITSRGFQAPTRSPSLVASSSKSPARPAF